MYDIYWHYFNNNLKYPAKLKNNIYTRNIVLRYYKDIIVDKVLTDFENCNIDFIKEITKIPERYISMSVIDKNIVQAMDRKKLLKSIKEENENIKSKITGIKKGLKYMTFDEAKYLMESYIKENNIIIDDVYTFNYDEVLKKSKAVYYVTNTSKDKLGFIMEFYDNKYLAYKFKIVSKRYWESRDNVDLTMKMFIENDLKIQIEKIPLYVTKNNLQMKARTLYGILYKKRYDSCLFDWIDRIYPGKFVEEDFHVGIIRNEFDSMEEKMVHDMLKAMFKNVVYNYRKSSNVVSIMGMQPDWFIFTDQNVYIIEYFGIAVDHGQYNKRIRDYTNKTKEKIQKYDDLPYAKKIFLFPDDFQFGFEGFYKKMECVV